MTREAIRKLIAPDGKPPAPSADARAEIDRLVAARKREIIERECFGLIEFVDAAARLRRRRRDGRGEEGSIDGREQYPRGKAESRADGDPLHRADGHRKDLRRRGVRQGVRADDDQAQELPQQVGGRHRRQPRAHLVGDSGHRADHRHHRRGRPRLRRQRRGWRRRHQLARHRAHQGVHERHREPRARAVHPDDQPPRQARRRHQARRAPRSQDPVPLSADGRRGDQHLEGAVQEEQGKVGNRFRSREIIWPNRSSDIRTPTSRRS